MTCLTITEKSYNVVLASKTTSKHKTRGPESRHKAAAKCLHLTELEHVEDSQNCKQASHGGAHLSSGTWEAEADRYLGIQGSWTTHRLLASQGFIERSVLYEERNNANTVQHPYLVFHTVSLNTVVSQSLKAAEQLPERKHTEHTDYTMS